MAQQNLHLQHSTADTCSTTGTCNVVAGLQLLLAGCQMIIHKVCSDYRVAQYWALQPCQFVSVSVLAVLDRGQHAQQCL